MAQADGTILIDTEINADGMKAGSKEVENAVRNMAKSVEDLGTKAKTALNKQVDAFTKLNAEYSAQQKKVDNLKKKVQEYGKQKIPTAEYKEIQNQIAQAEKRLNSLLNAQEKFIALGGKEDSQRYKSLQYDIDELANTIRYAEGELKDLEESGKAFTLGGETKEAVADMQRLEAEMRKLSDMNNRLGTSYSSIKGQVSDYKNDLLKTDKAQEKTSKSGKQLDKSLKNTGKSAKSASFGLGKMLGTSILFSAVFQAISGATNAIKEGFTNLAQYSGSTNKSISMLLSSLERLKNSLATTFAPILDVVAPILSKFIDMISTAASYVSMFFSFLQGKDTYTRAVAVQKDYAASLQDTAGAANDAADALDNYLSPLDDINRYENPNSSSGIGSIGGAGSGETSPGAMFEEVPIKNAAKIEEFLQNILKLLEPTIDALKRLWNEGLKELRDFSADALIDFYELFLKPLGKWVLGEGLPALIDVVNNFLKKIDWDKLNKALEDFWKALEPFAEAVGTGLIKFFDDLLSFGANVLNFVLPGIFEGLANILNSIDKEDAETIGYIIGAIITAATAKKMATAIANLTGLKNGLNNLKVAIANFKAGAPTAGNIAGLSILSWFGADFLADTLAEAITGMDFTSATTILKNTISGFLHDGIEGGIQNFVNGVGGNIAASVLWMMETLFGKDSAAAAKAREWAESSNFWSEFAKPWLDNLWNNIVKIGSNSVFGKAILPLFQKIGEIIHENASGGIFQTYIWPALTELGGNLISGIQQGILNAISSIGTWIKEHIFQPFINGFKRLFGIHSPSTVMAQMGQYLMDGLYQGISSFVNKITSVFWNIRDKITDAWNFVKSITNSIWNGILGVVKGVINGIIGGINGMIRGVCSGINAVIGLLNKIHITIPDWVPGFGGARLGFNISKLTAPQIPYLASGAVIPPNREFLAVLGDQSRGNNIEAPEGLLRRIIREETGTGAGSEYRFTAQLNRRTLFDEFINEARLRQKQTGKNPLELA